MPAPEYLDPRLTEHRNPRTERIDVASPLEIVDLINGEDATVAAAVHREREAVARAIELTVAAFQGGGRLVYVGAGTSGRLGVLDASECPPTFGTPPELVVGVIAGGLPALVKSQEGAEDDVNAGAAAMDRERVEPRDFVLGIAASGTTPFVRAALSRAQTLGAVTGLVSCSDPPKLLAGSCDVVILPRVGPEVLTGSTRMKAATATKLVLNTITTGAMIRMGRAYGNLMVDLMAWSDKLRDRGERIVMECCEVDREAARARHRRHRARARARSLDAACRAGGALRRRRAPAARRRQGRAARSCLHCVARPDDLARAGPSHAAAGRPGRDRRTRRRARRERLPLARRRGGPAGRAAPAAPGREAGRGAPARATAPQSRRDGGRHPGAAARRDRRRGRPRHGGRRRRDRRRDAARRPRRPVRPGRGAGAPRPPRPEGAAPAPHRPVLRSAATQEHGARAVRDRVRGPADRAGPRRRRLGE